MYREIMIVTPETQDAFLAAEYAEANRYMENARETLAKAKKDGPVYIDRKYVRTACGTAYNGVLIALDAWLAIKGVAPLPRKVSGNGRVKVKKPGHKPNKRRSIEFYTDNIAKLDGKLLSILISTYNVLHLEGYYDGNTCVKLITAGFDCADDIIDRIKPQRARAA